MRGNATPKASRMNQPKPLNPAKTPRATRIARTLRKQDHWGQELVWRWLRDRHFSAYKFRREHPYGPYFLDFFCVEALVNIEISDTGIGMNTQTQARIFERFFRADDAHSTPGFGLGLSIAQTIIKKHQGRIEVESALGTGTRITIWLPQKVDDLRSQPDLPLAPA